MKFPPKLKKGDTILLASPSSPLSPEQPVEQIAANVEALGFQVKSDVPAAALPPAVTPPPLRQSGPPT